MTPAPSPWPPLPLGEWRETCVAYWHKDLAEYILPYYTVRQNKASEGKILGFLDSTYSAAANLGNWDCAALEPRHWRGSL